MRLYSDPAGNGSRVVTAAGKPPWILPPARLTPHDLFHFQLSLRTARGHSSTVICELAIYLGGFQVVSDGGDGGDGSGGGKRDRVSPKLCRIPFCSRTEASSRTRAYPADDPVSRSCQHYDKLNFRETQVRSTEL